ncbi:MAG: exo-alpha-sialidase, partial [Methylophilaceae bacterium]
MNKYILLVLMLFCAQFSWAHGQVEHVAIGNLAISTAFDQAGKLWRVHIKDGFVLVSHSVDLGKKFSNSIKVNAEAQQVTA